MNGTDDVRLNLLFFSVGGVCFGVDTEQVSGIAAYSGEQADDLFWFHDEFNYNSVVTPYLSATIVTIKTIDMQPYRVVIDRMEAITEYSQDDILLFPPLLEPFAMRQGLWGLIPRHGRIVLLVDFQQLLKERQRDVLLNVTCTHE